MYTEEKIYRSLEKKMRCIWDMTLSNSGAGSVWGNEFNYLISNIIFYPKHLLVDSVCVCVCVCVLSPFSCV